jgi:hypothetical protein
MDDLFAGTGVAFGGIATISYLQAFWAKLTPADVFFAATIIFASVSATSGLKVCWYSVFYAEQFPMKDISVPSFFGGIAVCLTGLYTVYHRFKYRQ